MNASLFFFGSPTIKVFSFP